MERTRYEKIVYYLTAPNCIYCERVLDIDDFAYCKECYPKYLEAKARICSVCFKPYSECLCTSKYLDTHYVKKLIKLFRYRPSKDLSDDRAENRMIYNLKGASRIDTVKLAAHELSERIKASVRLDNLVITNVPRSRKRVISIGLDHMENLARKIAKRLNIPYVKTLRSRARGVQKKKRGEERLTNAEFDYRRRAPSLEGKRVLILDDVVTSGASLGGCAMLLRGLGAKEIIGVCLGIAFSDKYTPFQRPNFKKE